MTAELAEIKTQLAAGGGSDGGMSHISLRELLTRPVYRRPFLIAMGLMFFQQFNGINAIVFYTQKIFDQTGTSLDPGILEFATLLKLGWFVSVPFLHMYLRYFAFFQVCVHSSSQCFKSWAPESPWPLSTGSGGGRC